MGLICYDSLTPSFKAKNNKLDKCNCQALVYTFSFPAF